MIRRALAAAVLLIALMVVREASARPSIWDVAREPERLHAYRALLQAESSLVRAQESPTGSFEWRRHLRAALATLSEHVDGPDPRLRFFMAELLNYLGGGWERETRKQLEQALAEAPESPLAGEGWYLLALAAAKLEDRQTECAAYDRALQLIWQRNLRANIHYNRGDAKMGLGRLSEAIADFQLALSLSQDPDTQTLAYYGLGITLERQGDLPAALDAMHKASSMQHPAQPVRVLDDDRVFFVPEYDIYYYKALESMAAAKHEKDPESKQIDLHSAIAYWNRYLMQAEPDGHRWVSNATLHLKNCERDAK